MAKKDKLGVVTMVLSNPFKPDPRVFKEAKNLIKSGYKVFIIAWDRECKNKPEETYEKGFHVIRIQVRSQYKYGITRIIKFLTFYYWAIKKVINLKPAVIHCHDLDTLLVGIVGKLNLKCKLIYDAHEYYPEMVNLKKIFRKLLARLEWFLVPYADGVIAASTFTREKLIKCSRKELIVINNSSELSGFENISPKLVAEKRISLGIKTTEFLIVYVGGYSKYRKIDELIQAVAGLSNIKLVIVGSMEVCPLLHNQEDSEKIIHVGWVPPEEVPLYTSIADVCYYVYDPNFRYSDYVNPNGLFNALAAGRPILGTDVGDMGAIIRKERCGYTVDNPTVKNIRALLKKIKHDKSLKQYANNAKNASIKRYNWSHNEKLLIDFYNKVLHNCYDELSKKL